MIAGGRPAFGTRHEREAADDTRTNPGPRIPPEQHRSRAARLRVLAREATTARLREQLLDMARAADALAEGSCGDAGDGPAGSRQAR
jgi:hypothetical protein